MTRNARQMTSRPAYYSGNLLNDHKHPRKGASIGLGFTYALGNNFSPNAAKTSGAGANQLRGVIMPISDWVLLDKVAVHFQEGDTAATLSVAIYRDIEGFVEDGVSDARSWNHPALPISFDTLSATGTGPEVVTKDITPFWLAPGVYWVVCSRAGSASGKTYERSPAYYPGALHGGTLTEHLDLSALGILQMGGAQATLLWACFHVAQVSPAASHLRQDFRIQFDHEQSSEYDDDATGQDFTVSGANTISYMPFPLSVGRVLERIEVEHLSSVTTDFEVGLYTHDPDKGPDGLINKAITTSHANGIVGFDLDQYLGAGRYWIGVQVDAASAKFHGGISNNLMFADSVDNYPQFCMTEAGSTLPATATPSGGAIQGPQVRLSYREGVSGVQRDSTLTLPGSPLPIKGQYIGPMVALFETNSRKLLTANGDIDFVPILCEMPVRCLQVIVRQLTPDAAGSFRLGLYADDGSFYPGKLLEGSDPIAGTGTIGYQYVGGPYTMGPGLYWLACKTVNIGGVEFMQYYTTNPNAVFPSAAVFNDQFGFHETGTTVGDALPATAPTDMIMTSGSPRLESVLDRGVGSPHILLI